MASNGAFNGSEYNPNGTAVNASSYTGEEEAGKQSINLEDQYLQSLQEQYGNLSALPEKLKQAYQVGKSNLQSQAAQALAGSRASRGGGAGIAAARGTAVASGRQLGEMEQNSQLAQANALQQAAQAKTAMIGEQEKVAQGKAQRQAQISEAVGIVDSIIDKESGVFVTSGNDIANMKRRFQTEVASRYANNPEALQAAIQEFNSKLGGGKTTELFGSTSAATAAEHGV
jgi:hypothetical protein